MKVALIHAITSVALIIFPQYQIIALDDDIGDITSFIPRGPEQGFDDLVRPSAPYYDNQAAWAALPNKNDFADLTPSNTTTSDNQDSAQIDVFYIHPTTYQGSENWNQPLNLEKWNKWTDISVIARQASAFNGCCRIFAPRYRQAAAGALSSRDGSGIKAYAFAYTDVKRAFEYYLESYNDGRPFIIAGHSQGGLHAQTLLSDTIAGTALHKQLVAGYIIGIGVPIGIFAGPLKGLSPCFGPFDNGCVISWNTYGKGGNGSAFLARNNQRNALLYPNKKDQELLCTNPMSWRTNGTIAPASLNIGALHGKAALGALPGVKLGAVSSQCKDGVLYTDIPTDPDFVLNVFPGLSLHMHDMDLFYMNIRQNAEARARAYFH